LILELEDNHGVAIFLKNIIMKQLFLAIALLLSVVILNAQEFSKNKLLINFGVGITGWGIPVYGGLDFKVNKDITIGGEISLRAFGEDWYGSHQNNKTGVCGNINYHFNRFLEIPKNIDIYAGVNIGLYAWSNPNTNPESHSEGLGLGGQLGGRYYFSNLFGLNFELNGGNEIFGGKFGLTLKL